MKIYLAGPDEQIHMNQGGQFLFSFWDAINKIPFRKTTMKLLGIKLPEKNKK